MFHRRTCNALIGEQMDIAHRARLKYKRKLMSWVVRFIGIAQQKGCTVLTSIGLMLLLACAHGSTGSFPSEKAQQPNQVVRYLDGAERQAETDEQRQEILRALEDLRTLSPAGLKQRRYADYENKPEQWTLVQLLQKYFVPQELCSIDEETLYRDAQSPRARQVIEQQIRALREGRQVFPIPPDR